MPSLSKKYYHNIDLDSNQLLSAVIENRTSAPASGVDGQVYYNTVDKKIYYYNAALSLWQELGAGGGGGGGTSLPIGGTAGQILAKIDATNYSVEWIDNFTSQVKHLVKLGQNISKGQAVYVSSADGTNMIVSKASYLTESTSSKTIGLLQTGGVTNDQVYVITEGLLAGLNTSTANVGDPVWLGADGNLLYGIANKPYAPFHLVVLGVVTRVNSNNGEIFVHVSNGFEIAELHDVSALSPSDNDILQYVASTGLWTKRAGSTTNITEGTNLYFTDVRSRQAISLTTTGNSGSATYSNITGVLNIPAYTLAGLGGQPLATNLTSLSGLTYVSASFVKMTAAGTFTLDTNTYYLASNPSGYTTNTGTVTTVSVVSANGFAGTVATATSTPAITLTTTITGVLKGNGTAISAAVANTDYQSPITLTVTGSSGAATFNGTTLNIPTYTLAGLGGLTNPMTTLGDTIYGGVSGAVTRLAGNITTTKQYLSQTGTSTVSAAPAWSAIAGADVTGAALTKTDDTNVTLTLGGTPTTALLRAASLTLGWTGQLAVGRGGTGASTLTGVVIGNGASAMTAVSSSTALQVLRVNSGGTGYEFATISGGSLTDGDKGDITVSASGATWTIDNQAVTYAKIQNVTDARLLGRSAGTAGSVQEISIGSGLSLSGGILSSVAGGGSVTTVSVVSANGFAGTVANASSTPAITLTTTITGILKGNGTAISAAVANTDYLAVDDPLYTGTLSTGSLSFGPQAANPLLALESSVNSYNQSLIQNSSAGTQASSDIIVNNDQSTDTTFYGDYGINSSNYTGSGSISLPNAVYLYSAGGPLVLGTLSTNDIHFFTNGSTTDSMLIKSTNQIQFNGYTSLTSFTGTLVGYLGFDSSGNIITTDPPAYSVISVSTTHNETATFGTKIIKADTTAGAFTINLPTAANNKATIIIKKVAGTPDLTVDAQASQTIDGGLTAILRVVDESITLVSDNSNWQIV
jgi:acetylglutamate kinase